MKNNNKETGLEVTQVQETAVAVSGARQGFENVDASSITIPRAKLLQANSPEVSDRDYNFRAGDVIHALTMDKLPETFIPIMFLPDTNIMFVPREAGAKQSMKARLNLTDEEINGTSIICRSKDGKIGNKYGSCANCNLCKFNDKTNEKPLCTSSINVLVLPEGEDMPVVIQFSNTSKKHGVKFKNTTYFKKGSLFENKYKIASIQQSNNGNSWYEMSIKPAGKPDETQIEAAKQLFDTFSNLVISVEEEPEVHSNGGSAPLEY